MKDTLIIASRKIKREWKMADIRGLVLFTIKIVYTVAVVGITWRIIN